MPDKKLTDNEIIKALEDEIHLAEYVDSGFCNGVNLSLIKSALDLINRLQKLKEHYKKCRDKVQDDVMYLAKQCDVLQEELKTAKAKALNEAASKFAGHSDYHGDTILCTLYCMAEGKEVGNAKPLDTSKIKAEAYKEFAERLNKEAENVGIDWDGFLYSDSDNTPFEIYNTVAEWCKDVTDNILKELVGDADAS